MNVFNEMGIYWAEMADKLDTERQIEFIKQTLTAKGLILDFACGTGRHSIPLSKDGYGMVGLDVSRRLLKIAKNRWSRVQVVRGDMRFLPFKADVFSGVVSMASSFGYLPSEQDDIQSLSEIEKILGPNGVFAVDVFNRERLVHKYMNKNKSKLVFLSILLRFHNRLSSWVMTRFFEWTEFQGFSLLKVRTVSSDSSVDCLRDMWVVRDKTSRQIKVFRHTARLYKLRQLQGWLEHAGFAISKVYGDYERQTFGPDSSRLILVAYVK